MKRALRSGSLARWAAEAACAVLFAWVFSYYAINGTEYPWILYFAFIALGFLFLDVVAYLVYNYF